MADRIARQPEGSYTAELFSQGPSRIAQKIGEEGVEVALAAVGPDDAKVVGESADLLYHLLVLWADRGLKPSEVWDALAAREGISGLEEKASRKNGH